MASGSRARMAVTVTIHFQEGFAGEVVELWRGAERLGAWRLRTRLQTGLAAIETVSLEPGGRIRLALEGAGADAGVEVEVPGSGGAAVLLVNLEGGVLRVRFVADEPGYL